MSNSRRAQIFALSAGQTVARLIGLATSMVMARVLIKEDLAAYRQTFLAYATVAPLLTLGVGQGIYYFLPAETERVRGRVVDGLSVLGLTGLLYAIFLACGGNALLASRFSNPQVAGMLLWLIPYSVVTLPAGIASNVLVARQQTTLASVFAVVQQIAIGLATVVPLVVWKSAEAPLVGNVTASVLMGLAAITLIFRSLPKDSLLPRPSAAKELLVFSLPLGLAGMIGSISLQLDKLIVSALCPPDEFAVYALGALEIPLIGVVTGAITSVLLADMRRSVAGGDHDEAIRLFRRTAELSSYVILPAMIFLLITADSFIQLLYTSRYAASAIPFRCYLMLLPVRTVVFGSLILALGKSRFILFRASVNLCLNAALSLVLVRRFGPWGAVAATVVTMYLWVVPANLYLISSTTERSWYTLLPFRELAGVCLAMTPVALISVGLVLVIEEPLIEFAAVAACFAGYLAWYWNNKIYSIESILKRVQLSLGASP